eukprot:363437-Chlamydomonas_euryale.AAC.11
MDGWMDGRTDGRTDGWMDGWINRWMNGGGAISSSSVERLRAHARSKAFHACVLLDWQPSSYSEADEASA